MTFTFHRNDAGHAFASEDPVIHTIGLQEDPQAGALAWERTLEFFDRHLGADGNS